MKEELIKSLAVNGGEKAVKSLPPAGISVPRRKRGKPRIRRGYARAKLRIRRAEEEALCREFSRSGRRIRGRGELGYRCGIYRA